MWSDLYKVWRLASVGGGAYGWANARSAYQGLGVLQKTPVGKKLKAVEVAFAVITVAGIISLVIDCK